jgi:probable blue pigment (indigoidine) exporter
VSRRELLAILFVTSTWGTAYVAVKEVLVGMPTITSAGLRFLLAGALLLLLARAIGRAGDGSRSAWMAASVVGLLQTTGLFGLAYLALREEAAGSTAVLMNLTPLFAMVTAVPILGERLDVRKLTGLAVAGAGVFLVSSGRPGGSTLGITLIICAALCWGLATVVAKRVSVGDPLPLAGRQMLVGSVPLLALGALEPQRYDFDLAVVAWFWYGVILAGVAAFGVWFWLIERHESGPLSTFLFLMPVFGVLAGVLILGERIGGGFVAGSVLVLFGVWLCQRPVGPVEPSTPPTSSAAAALIGAELRPAPQECRR